MSILLKILKEIGTSNFAVNIGAGDGVSDDPIYHIYIKITTMVLLSNQIL
jgi:hypothetical protein